MNVALAVTVALSASAGPVSAPQGADGAQLVRDACVGTDLQRAAFERLGRERGWRSQRMTRRSGEPGWTVAYRAGDALVMLMGSPAPGGERSSLAVACSVSVDRADPGLEDDVAALAASLDLEGAGVVKDTPPGFVPIRIWSRFEGHTLTYAASPDGRAVISFSRQIVTHLPDAMSPPVGS